MLKINVFILLFCFLLSYKIDYCLLLSIFVIRIKKPSISIIMKNKIMLSLLLTGALFTSCGQQTGDIHLPELPPMPEVAASKPVNSVPLGMVR